MLELRHKRPLDFLNGFSTFFSKSVTFWRNNDMTNIKFHTSFRWVIRFGYIYKKRVSWDTITSFVHFAKGHIPPPR